MTNLVTIKTRGGVPFTVAADYAPRFEGLLNDLEARGYPIKSNQSGGYNDRLIAGSKTKSNHAYGAAVDVNWNENGRGTKGNIPPEVARELAATHGLTWGGDWRNPDPMHFEYRGANGVGSQPEPLAPSSDRTNVTMNSAISGGRPALRPMPAETAPVIASAESDQPSVVPDASPKFDLMKLASLFASDDTPKLAPPQLSPIPVNAFQSSPIGGRTPYTFANGGQVRGGSSGEPIHAGPLHSTVPGRTDHLPITVAEGSFVLPADVVSGLGQGNTNAGMQVVEQMFPLPRIRRMSGGRVPIAAAGGEFVIHPDTVAQLGGGDLSKGHKALDDFVLRTRAQTINKLRALPPPEKS